MSMPTSSLICSRAPDGHAADFLDEVGQFLGVFGQPAGTDHQEADDQQKEKLRAVDSKHFRKITLSLCRSS